MAYNNGGGWWFRPRGEFTGSSTCYAGNGCTYIPLEVPNPLGVISDLKGSVPAGKCQGGRVGNINEFMPDTTDEFFVCGDKENPVAREGGAIYCNRAVDLDFNTACGTGALLSIAADEGTTGPWVQIEQNSLVGFSLVTGRAIQDGNVFSDAACFVQNNVATCEAGWTYIHIWPANHQCTYDKEDCDISCGTSEGFSRVGCCPSAISCDKDGAADTVEDTADEKPEDDGTGDGGDQNDAAISTDDESTESNATGYRLKGFAVGAAALISGFLTLA